MTEPMTLRGKERKGAIVGAAAALMYERGMRATSIDDVLAASGSGKSQLYHYFSGRDELVAAVLEHQLASVLGELGRFQLDTWTGWRAWFDHLLEGQRDRDFRGCPVGSLAVEMTAGDGHARRAVAEAFSRWEAVLAEGLGRMRRRGTLVRAARPAELAERTLASVQGGYLLSTARAEIEPMRAALRGAYTHLRSHGRSRPSAQ